MILVMGVLRFAEERETRNSAKRETKVKNEARNERQTARNERQTARNQPKTARNSDFLSFRAQEGARNKAFRPPCFALERETPITR